MLTAVGSSEGGNDEKRFSHLSLKTTDICHSFNVNEEEQFKWEQAEQRARHWVQYTIPL